MLEKPTLDIARLMVTMDIKKFLREWNKKGPNLEHFKAKMKS